MIIDLHSHVEASSISVSLHCFPSHTSSSLHPINAIANVKINSVNKFFVKVILLNFNIDSIDINYDANVQWHL